LTLLTYEIAVYPVVGAGFFVGVAMFRRDVMRAFSVRGRDHRSACRTSRRDHRLMSVWDDKAPTIGAPWREDDAIETGDAPIVCIAYILNRTRARTKGSIKVEG
jgi:hypothetical protein